LSWQEPNISNVATAKSSWGKVVYAMDLHVFDAGNVYIMALFQADTASLDNREGFHGLIIKRSVDCEGCWERVGSSQGDWRSQINHSAVQATKIQIINLI
jgi:hypothetical protein